MFLESIEEIQQVVRITNRLNNYEFIQSKKDAIIHEYLLQYFTPEFIESIEGMKYSDDSVEKSLFNFMNKAIIKLAVLKSIPELEISISDIGITRQESDNDKTAYSGQIARFETSLEDDSFVMIDSLIGLCYSSDIELFEDCPIYKMNDGLVFKSATEFSQRIRLYRRFITFYQLHPILLFVQNNFINSRFPTAVFDLIMTGTSSEQKRAKEFLLFGVAYHTMAEALLQGLVQFTAEGVKFIGTDNTQTHSQQLPASSDQISAQLKRYQSMAKQQLEMVSFIIQSDPTNFGIVNESPTPKNTFFV